MTQTDEFTTEQFGDTPPPMGLDDPLELDDLMEKAETPERDFADLPDGMYIGYVYMAKAGRFASGQHIGKDFVTVRFRVMDGEKRGKTQGKMYRLVDATGAGFFKADVATFGIDVASEGMTWASFVREGGIQMLQHRIVQFQVKRKPNTKNPGGDPFVNVFVNKLVSGRAIDDDLLAMDEGRVSESAAAVGASTGEFSL